MPYLSLMIDSSDMPFDASSAESGRTADAPGALPRPPTSFVGRQHELADARRLLAHNRLLTLTGPGGCGKTRLAIELAAGVAERSDGVPFVSLAAVRDPALVPVSIAQALGLQDARRRSLLAHLSGYLATGTSCWSSTTSSMSPAGGFVGDCSARPPLGSWSRVGRRCTCRGSRSSRCRPCGYRSRVRSRSAAWFACESVELFAARAAASVPGFTVDEGNAARSPTSCAVWMDCRWRSNWPRHG